VNARYGLVQVYTEAPGIMGGSYEKAFDQAKEIGTVDPVLGHRAYAFICSQQKKLDLPNKEYADAIREEPKSGKAHSFYGQYLASIEKNYAAALVELETALKIDPHYMPALYHLGRIASLANTNLARGEEALKQYLAYKGERADARQRAHLPRRPLREGREEGGGEAGLRGGAQAQSNPETGGGRVETRLMRSESQEGT